MFGENSGTQAQAHAKGGWVSVFSLVSQSTDIQHTSKFDLLLRRTTLNPLHETLMALFFYEYAEGKHDMHNNHLLNVNSLVS